MTHGQSRHHNLKLTLHRLLHFRRNDSSGLSTLAQTSKNLFPGLLPSCVLPNADEGEAQMAAQYLQSSQTLKNGKRLPELHHVMQVMTVLLSQMPARCQTTAYPQTQWNASQSLRCQ